MATSPAEPSDIFSPDHTRGVSSTDNTITVNWKASTDADKDLNGYATLWDNFPDTVLWSKNRGPTATSDTSDSLGDGSWYFHIRAIDDGGNYSKTVHYGPFIIDTQPDIFSVNPGVGNRDSATGVVITGTDFMSGATVMIGDIEIENVTFVSSTELRATIPEGTEPGTYDIKVTNPNSRMTIKNSGFQVAVYRIQDMDINEDDAVDLTDMILGLKVLAGLNPAGIQSADEVNSDGRIEVTEVICILRVLSELK
ncbi:Immunoglobulin like fold-containing protein [Desulfonema magnum]|uniref:Immunoglobulin like fold-containing protein n=2 Tax=Desulfonema magnum TaxID=45655 RepID=A0A975GL42_9BACT|nr:Immunoglobulin like fold-containing protein [Desulfonema magnum]